MQAQGSQSIDDLSMDDQASCWLRCMRLELEHGVHSTKTLILHVSSSHSMQIKIEGGRRRECVCVLQQHATTLKLHRASS